MSKLFKYIKKISVIFFLNIYLVILHIFLGQYYISCSSIFFKIFFCDQGIQLLLYYNNINTQRKRIGLNLFCVYFISERLPSRNFFSFSSFSEKRVSSYNNRCAYIWIYFFFIYFGFYLHFVENTTQKICIYTFFFSSKCVSFFSSQLPQTLGVQEMYFSGEPLTRYLYFLDH